MIRSCIAVTVLAAVTVQAQAPSDKADALSDAARKGDAAAVRKLLDEGVDVNTKFRYDRMALSFAADRGHAEVVKVLLERGANLDAKDTFYNATALTWAVNPAMGRNPGHAEVVRLLLQKGAQGKEQALMGAVGAKDAAMVKVILDVSGLQAGNLSDALAAATRAKSAEIVALLETAGAKPHAEVKLDPALLARYAGSYKGPNANLVIAVAGDRLTAAIGTTRLTLAARDATTFGALEQGLTMTFTIEQDKVTKVTVNVAAGGPPSVFPRVEDK